ncbi:hypothetical protein R3P38DRAFT_2837761 [Favolaschia claudopus]|uniref:Uncharacterized protein n=1 Tax=Favolaschia claudopus TaxID=2862362 RepID=A0AAW0E8F2_9AGAR
MSAVGPNLFPPESMSRPHSPPPFNASIENAASLLPSVNLLFDEVLQRERSGSQSSSGSRAASAWAGLPGPDRVRRASPAMNKARQLPPLQVRATARPQTPSLPKAPAAQNKETQNQQSTREATPEIPPPGIPNRMGGRYAQTPYHKNGQPHAPGLMPKASSSRHPGAQALAGTAPNRVIPVISTKEAKREAAKEAFTRIYHGLLKETLDPLCVPCINDIRIESRRQVSGIHGPGFSQFAHGLKPQHATQLPEVPNLITIPFTPKHIKNCNVLLGVSLTEILDFRDVLYSPRERVLDDDTTKIIFLMIEHPGFPPVVTKIPGNCPHRPVSRFNLAFSVAEAYSNFFKTHNFDANKVTPGSMIVRSVTQLRLVNLYTIDRTNYRAHLAYVF